MERRCGLVSRRKHFDDAHRLPTPGTREGGWRGVGLFFLGLDRLGSGLDTEQRPDLGKIRRAPPVGEKPVVANAMETRREDMDEKAADELLGAEGHGFISEGSLRPVVFVLKGDLAQCWHGPVLGGRSYLGAPRSPHPR